VLCLSAVNWLGQRYPLQHIAKVCRRRNVLLAIDGSQAVGMIDISPVEIDLAFFCTTFFKWAFAPVGIGCAYFRHDLRGVLRPEMVSLESAGSVRPGDEPRLPAFPAPLVLAVPPPLCLAGLNAALSLVMDADPATTERRILKIAASANDEIMSAGYWTAPRTDRDRSGIVLFSVLTPPASGEVPKVIAACNEALRARLRLEGIHVDLKAGLLRASFHVAHRESDLKRLRFALRHARSSRVAPSRKVSLSRQGLSRGPSSAQQSKSGGGSLGRARA
jgi:selenocysteine lyase/cysteine desulfurase